MRWAARGRTAGMTMRYLPKASADRLAALVDDVHFATRLPKHLIMGAGLVAIAAGSALRHTERT